MKTMKITILAMFLSFSGMLFSQKITILEGSLAPLKGQKVVNVEYDYSNFGVGKFKTEKEYVDTKVKEYNQKEAGKGDKWKESWEGDRIGRFQPMFEELINKSISKQDIFVGNEKTGKYKMIVRTTFVEPGFNIYITKKYASINLLIDIVETANPSNVVCQIVSKGNPGRTYGYDDFDTGVRISEAYALAGKKMGAFMSKKMGK